MKLSTRTLLAYLSMLACIAIYPPTRVYAQPVQIAGSVVPPVITMQSAVTGNANGTTLNMSGYSSALISVTASVAMSGGTTINFECSVDASTWVSCFALQVGTNTMATSTTTTGDYAMNVGPYNNVRARVSAYSAGTITVKGYRGSLPQTMPSHNVNVIGTVPVSGTFFQATQPVSVVSLPLPTLAATSTKQSDGTQKTQIVDGSGNVIASTTNALNVSITNATIAATQSGAWSITNISGTVSLPTGASTETTLAAINTNAGAIADAASATGSISAKLRFIASTGIPITGTVAVTQSGGWTVALGAGSAVIGHVIADSGSTTAVTGNVAVTVADGESVTFVAKADAKSTSTDTTPITMMQVMKQISASVQAPPSQAVTNAGTFPTQATLQAGSALAGEVVPVTTATTTDTALRCPLVSTASTNSTSCKGSAGNVYGYRFVNTTTTIYYLRMYNSSSAPTCSSATNYVETIPVPPASAAGGAGGVVAMEPMGEGYSIGIGFCFTGGSSSTDNTNAAAGTFGEVLYK